MFRSSWVQIPALYTGWTFFTFICCQNCNDVCLKRTKIKEKGTEDGPFLKKLKSLHDKRRFLNTSDRFELGSLGIK